MSERDPASGAAEQPSFPVEIGRAFAGALIFALPILMTMEMWELGFHMDPFRLALLLAVNIPLLVALSKYSGLRPTERLRDDMADAFVAIAVATVACLLLLWTLGLLKPGMSLREIVGKVAIQVVPASIGAMLAQDQLGGHTAGEEEERHPSYAGEIFLMVVGALFLSLNIAPTEEMVLIGYTMSIWQEVGLVALSLALLHAFVYLVEFRGTESAAPGAGFLQVFLRFTVVGYAAVLLVSLYILWTFGRTDGASLEEVMSAAVVLGFPGAIGAAVARLII